MDYKFIFQSQSQSHYHIINKLFKFRPIYSSSQRSVYQNGSKLNEIISVIKLQTFFFCRLIFVKRPPGDRKLEFKLHSLNYMRK